MKFTLTTSLSSFGLYSQNSEICFAVLTKSVLVISDTSIPVERLIDVVDECRMSGAKDVAVSTTKEMG